nr:DUF2142 domain-containing protein [Bifidobacterium sp. DSM 109957]
MNITAVVSFAIVALVQCVFFIGHAGAFSMPDPSLHLPSTYALATGQSGNDTEYVTDEYGNRIRRQYLRAESGYLSVDMDNSLTVNVIRPALSGDSAQIISKQRASADAAGKPIEGFYRSTQYAPTNYVPQAIGLAVGRALGVAPYQAWQMARVTNFLVFVLLMGFAIWVTPWGKSVLVVIGVLPTTVFVACSLMPDGQFIAFSACFIALTVASAHERRPMGLKTYVALLLLGVLLLYGKPLYCVVALLALVLPHHVLSMRRKAIALGIVVIAAIAYLWWSSRYSGGLYAVNMAANREYIMERPWKPVVMALWNMLCSKRELDVLGANYMYLAVAFLSLVLLAFIKQLWQMRGTTSRGCIRMSSLISRWRYAICALIGFLMCLWAIYFFEALTWNDVSSMSTWDMLEGFQGRYILPILPLAVALHCVKDCGRAGNADNKSAEA